MALISLDFTTNKVVCYDNSKRRVLSKARLCSMLISLYPSSRPFLVSSLYYDYSYSKCKELLSKRVLELKLLNDSIVSNMTVIL